MDFVTLLMWFLALLLGGLAYFRPGKLHLQGFRIAGENTLIMFPRIIMAMLVSGFFSVLVPGELIAHWLGKDSGTQGILIGSLVGAFTPGGPIICFPIVAILFKSGAAVGPMIAFLTSWSVYAIHRIFTFEIPLLGSRFAMVRILSCIILPPLAGILAAALDNLVMG